MKRSLPPIALPLIPLALAALAAPAPLSAGEAPLEVIRGSNEAILAIYAGAEKIDAAKEAEIFAIIDGVTDFETIATAVTERFCRDLSAEQCREFREVFIELLRVSSVKKLGRYRADSFDYLGEEVGAEEAVVSTVAHYKDERISLVYGLSRAGGGWRIVNYIVDDVDTVRNYRKQFKRLFAEKSFGEVIQRLRDRIAAYRQEASS